MHIHNGINQGPRALEVTPTNGDQKDGSMHKGNDSDSSSKSESSHTESTVEGNCSGTNFSGSMSCSSGTTYSRNVNEVENDGGLDDWEAVTDALLAATDDNHEQCDQKFESLVENENGVQLDHLPEVVKLTISTVDILKPEPEKCDDTFKSSVEDEDVAQLNQRPDAVMPFIQNQSKDLARHGGSFDQSQSQNSASQGGAVMLFDQRRNRPRVEAKAGIRAGVEAKARIRPGMETKATKA